MQGIFELTTPHDLLLKLQRELSRLRAAPNDADHAFNYFVTAEHLLDWLYPGKAGKRNREAFRKNEVLLQLVSHLANGAKHFNNLASHHQSVASTGHKRSALPNPTLRLLKVGTMYGPGKLGVTLDGNAKDQLGDWISAIELAGLVYDYWATPGRIPI